MKQTRYAFGSTTIMYLNINGRFLRRLVDFKVVLQAVNAVVLASEGRDLSQVEEDVLRGAWEGLTYPELAKTSSYSLNYLKQDIGPNLWKLLSRVMGEDISKSTFRSFAERYCLQKFVISEEPKATQITEPKLAMTPPAFSDILSQLDRAYWAASEAIGDRPKKLALANAYAQMAKAHLALFSKNISELKTGTVTIGGRKRLTIIIHLLKQLLCQLENRQDEIEPIDLNPKPSLYGVSYGNIYRWWETAIAREFRDLNGELSKYIPVKRIFILPDRTAEENMKATMDWHRYLGIEVYALVCDDPELQVNFFVCDGLFTNLSNIAKNGDEIDGYISVKSQDIARDVKRFQAIEKLYGSQMRKIELED
jgi:hypothetical protein